MWKRSIFVASLGCYRIKWTMATWWPVLNTQVYWIWKIVIIQSSFFNVIFDHERECKKKPSNTFYSVEKSIKREISCHQLIEQTNKVDIQNWANCFTSTFLDCDFKNKSGDIFCLRVNSEIIYYDWIQVIYTRFRNFYNYWKFCMSWLSIIRPSDMCQN